MYIVLCRWETIYFKAQWGLWSHLLCGMRVQTHYIRESTIRWERRGHLLEPCSIKYLDLHVSQFTNQVIYILFSIWAVSLLRKAKMKFCYHIGQKISSVITIVTASYALYFIWSSHVLSIYPRMVILVPPVKLLYILFSTFVVVNSWCVGCKMQFLCLMWIITGSSCDLFQVTPPFTWRCWSGSWNFELR